MKLDLVVFDWDGTLMDSGARIVACMTAAAVEAGLEPAEPDAIRHLIGLSLPETYATLYPGLGDQVYARLQSAYRAQWRTHDKTPMPLFDGVEEGLAELEDSGLMLSVATGKSREGLDRVLDEIGLRSRFVFTRCADEARPKPDPAMLLDVLDRTGVESHRAIMVGDTSYDMQMAGSASVPGLGVTYGSHSSSLLREHGAIGCCDDFRAVVGDILSRQNA